MEKEIFEDKRLGWASKGVMAYLLSKPESWILHVYDIANKTNRGSCYVNTIFRELRKYGYIKLVPLHDENTHKFMGNGYVFGDWYYEFLMYKSSVPYNKTNKQYASVEWQKKRLLILERDEWRCTECNNDKGMMHVHHLKYPPKDKPVWDIEDEFLVTLCSKCHAKKHKNKLKSEK